MSPCFYLTAAIVVVLAIVMAFLHTNPGEVSFADTSAPSSGYDLITIHQEDGATPESLHNGTHYVFGRFSSPVPKPELRDSMNVMERTFQKKEWIFNAVSTDRYMFGFAIADLGYVDSGFVYWIDTKSGLHDSYQFSQPGFLSGSRVATSNVLDGACSSFDAFITGKATQIEVCFDAAMNGWHVDVRTKLERKSRLSVQFDLIRSGGPELAMNYPIGPDRAGYTHKTAGLVVNGSMTLIPRHSTPSFSKEDLSFFNEPITGTGLSDFSRSQSRRFTEWFWMAASFTEKDEDNNLSYRGFQLSSNTVGTLESMVWVDGEMHWIDSPLTVTYANISTKSETEISPGERALQPYNKDQMYVIKSADGRVDIQFMPIGVLPNKVSTPLINGSFYHSYGLYFGTIKVNDETTIRINQKKNGKTGVFEDHSLKW